MSDSRRKDEAGMALVLALLSLMLLTFLGLTLATTTSTELQIANNYRWSQQAFYNAEAGLEVGKKVLIGVDWATVIPTQRGTTWTGATTPAAAAGTVVNARDYENWQCDQRGYGAGYGKVLNVSGTPYANMSSVFSQSLSGTFTVWVRRPVIADPANGLFGDAPGSDVLILTAEGIAPFVNTQLSSVRSQVNKAVRTMEVRYSRVTTTETCGARGGQVGGSEHGAGFGGCMPVTAASLGAALGMGTPIENTSEK